MKTGGFCVEADVDNGNTMNKKVRNAQLAQFNFIFGELHELFNSHDQFNLVETLHPR